MEMMFRLFDIRRANTPIYELEYRMKNVSKDFFNKTKDILDTTNQFEITEKEYTSTIYEKGIREIDNEFYLKEAICALHSDTSKISLASEQISYYIPEAEQIIEKRKIHRYSYQNDFYTIDISIVNEHKYEIEVEIKPEQFDTNELLINDLRQLLQFLQLPFEENEYNLKVFNQITFLWYFNEDNDFGKLYYNVMFNRNGFIGKKPQTLTRKNGFHEIQNKEYYATEKIDGERVQIIHFMGNAYVVNTILDIIDVIQTGILIHCVLDAERLEEGTLVTFDVLYPKIDTLTDKITMLKQFPFRSKEFRRLENIQEIYSRNYNYEIDGIILMPEKQKQEYPIYKWKPIEQQTIDFLVEIQGNKWVLKCGNNQFDKRIQARRYQPVIFNPDRVSFYDNKVGVIRKFDSRYDGYKTNTIIEMFWDFELKQFVPLRTRDDKTREYQQGMTQYGNDLFKTVMPIWEYLKNPISLDTIASFVTKEETEETEKTEETEVYYQKKETREEREKGIDKNIRNYNNRVKQEYLEKYINKVLETQEKVYILDLGSGRGGDLQKINKKGVYYYGVEYDPAGVEEANRRLEKLGANKKAEFISFRVQDFTKLFNLGIKFDIISCQFAVHYSFKDMITAKSFCLNVYNHSKKNTYFLVSYIDANELVFKDTNEITYYYRNPITREVSTQPEGNFVSVSKEPIVSDKYQYNYELLFWNKNTSLTFPIPYGYPINVYIHSIGQFIEEYLVDPNRLTNELQQTGYSLVETKNFSGILDSVSELDEEEKRFVQLHRYSVYQIENTNDFRVQNERKYQFILEYKENKITLDIFDNLPNTVWYYEMDEPNVYRNLQGYNGYYVNKNLNYFTNINTINDILHLDLGYIAINIITENDIPENYYNNLPSYNYIDNTPKKQLTKSEYCFENKSEELCIWTNEFLTRLLENWIVIKEIPNPRNTKHPVLRYEKCMILSKNAIHRFDTQDIKDYFDIQDAVVLENNIEEIYNPDYELSNDTVIVYNVILSQTDEYFLERLVSLTPNKVIICGISNEELRAYIQDTFIHIENLIGYMKNQKYIMSQVIADFIDNNSALVFDKQNLTVKEDDKQLVYIPIDIIDVSRYKKKLLRDKKSGKIIEAFILVK